MKPISLITIPLIQSLSVLSQNRTDEFGNGSGAPKQWEDLKNEYGFNQTLI